MSGANDDKRIEWMGSSFRDLFEMADGVKRDIGRGLREAQKCEKADSAKVLRGFGGASVLEVVSDYDKDTYRGVYTVQFPLAVYVLHVFKKKSKSGIATPKEDLEVIKARLKQADLHYAEKYGNKKERRK